MLVKALNGSVAQLQHAPSNTGALTAGVSCWNITTSLGATGSLPQPWDLIVFNFGLHVSVEPRLLILLLHVCVADNDGLTRRIRKNGHHHLWMLKPITMIAPLPWTSIWFF
eukprot:COSAG06_NODE_27150_length_599_cov_1.222000_1_plen_110_part_01